MVSRRDVLTAFGALCTAPFNAYASAAEAKRSAERSISGGERVKPDFDANGNVLDRWWASLPLNRWLEVIDTDFISHVTPLLPKGFRDFGTIGLKGVFHAWCGAAFDRSRGRMFFFGGGHQDSSNNGLYEFALERMAWRVAMAPSILTKADIEHSRASWNATQERWISYRQGYEHPHDYWRDGKPTSIHTYRDLDWREASGEVLLLGYKHIWAIDPKKGIPRMCSKSPWMSDSSAVFDEKTQRWFLFRIDANTYWSFRVYDAKTDVVSALRNLDRTQLTASQLPVQVGRRIVLAASATPFVLDLETLEASNLPTASHPKLYASTGDYSERLGKIFCMNHPSTRWGSFSVLDPLSGDWEQYTPSSAPPPPGNANPPYSKFRIYERKNGIFMVLFHVANHNVCICRIA